MDYIPEALPDEGLEAYLQRELDKVANAVNVKEELQLETLHVEPLRPRDGMLIYADGTDFNPGSGLGFYGRENGIWVKL